MRFCPPITVIAFGVLLVPAPRAAGDLLSTLQNHLRELTDFQARFTQTFHSQSLGSVPVEKGIVYVKFPGRMRWEYTQPAGKLAVVDGERTYLYLPEDRLAYVGNWEDLLEEGAAVLLLTGNLDIDKQFLVERVADGPEIPSGSVRLRLLPRQANSRFEVYYLDLNQTGTLILGVLMEDPLGNRVEYRFSKIRENSGLSDELFRFEPPPGIDLQGMGSPRDGPADSPR